MTDKAALRAIIRGDETALEALIERYASYVSTIINNIIGTSMRLEDVEEVTSDVFFILWNNARKPESDKLKPWLGAVARNAAKMKLRETVNEIPLDEEYFDTDTDDMANKLTADDEAKIVRQAIMSLAPPDKEIFLSHYYGLQPIAQIAEKHGLSVSAVKMRLSRGREKLRAELTKGALFK